MRILFRFIRDMNGNEIGEENIKITIYIFLIKNL